MVSLVKLTAVLILVLLPTLIAARSSTQCKASVSQKLTETANKYYTYAGTISNVGSVPISNIILTPSDDLNSISGLRVHDGTYTYGDGIAVGDSYDFTFTVRKGTNVQWTTTLSCSAATAAPVIKPTSAPTSKHTTAPTAAPTTKPPKATTAVPTTKPPKATTAAPSSTKAATPAPTTKAGTSAPTNKATVAPTNAAPTAGGRRCPAGTWWAPAPQTTYQWQLTGTIDQSVNVQMYDIDLFDNDASVITSLHNAGRVVICYFSTQYENWRPDASSWTSAVLGDNLDDWAGEKYVDIRSPVVRAILTSRLDLAVSKGCDGVEPDNVDGYEAKTGFPLTAADQISFNTFIATQAHARGLSVGLKNDIDQATALEPSFDWALNEQCYQYSECSSLNIFITKGKAVFNTEYSGSASKVCPSMVTSKFSSLIKDLDLDASIAAQCCTYQTGGCAAVPYKCISAMTSRDVDYEEEASAIETTEST